MKITKLCCIIASFILILAGGAMAADFVDIGNPASEALHPMASWGPIEPATHPGSYGGIDHCRAIWTAFDTPVPGSIDAFIDLTFSGGSELLSFKHLDGSGNDSFEVWIDGAGPVFTYTDSGLPGETWYISSFSVSLSPGFHTVRFEAIGQQWSGWGTFGQVCFAEVGVGGTVPAQNSTWDGVKSLYR